MVEPTDQSFSTVFFPYPRDSTWRTWNPHPNPVSTPPPMTNLDSTTMNTTNSHKKSKRMHRKPTTTTKNPNPPTALNHNHNLPQNIQTNVQTTSTTAQTSLTTTKNPNPTTHKCIANPNHKHSKPKLRILRSETQIMKLDTKMNWFGKRDEREKMPERETDLQRKEREREKTKARSGLSLNWSHSGSW